MGSSQLRLTVVHFCESHSGRLQKYKYSAALICTIFTVSSLLTCILMNEEQSGLFSFLRWPLYILRLSRAAVNREVIILMWTSFFGKTFNDTVFELCPNLKCKITSDRQFFNTSEAVVFHDRSIIARDLPGQRLSNQHYVLFLLESPYHSSNIALQDLSEIFTLTMSYRRDADIHFPYGWIRRRSKPLSDELWNEIRRKVQGKHKKVAWFVSNCKTPSKREEYVRQLQRYINVDIYGACGTLKCPKTNETCFEEIVGKRYKFYIAMENSVCKDYVTEKYFDRLKNIVVPIVLGRHIYSAVGPNSSFIAADDFPSPKALAEHLLSLDKDTDAYMKYLDWMRSFEAVGYENYYSNGFCNLCRYLHERDPTEDVEPSASASNLWVWYKENASCRLHYGQELIV